MKLRLFITAFIGLALIIWLATDQADSKQAVSIAFLPDIHLHDIFAPLSDGKFSRGVTDTPSGPKSSSIRSMRAQLNSTRLFNENYYALLATLDDIAGRGITLVALPGDFSDDGQTVHVKGLAKILKSYQQQYGMSFFAAPGNHDPSLPFTNASGKWDYLADDGQEQPVFSPGHKYCQENAKLPENKAKHRKPVSCITGVENMGYRDLMAVMGSFGFFPKPNYLYFATPFYTAEPERYQFSQALAQSSFASRNFTLCEQGSPLANAAHSFRFCGQVMDASYVVEPIDGLWLLSVDANVYQPKPNSSNNSQIATNYRGSGNAGYNKVLSHKPHLSAWLK
jgi:3',5'-cyclic AMP phosphodiesterase CpdA